MGSALEGGLRPVSSAHSDPPNTSSTSFEKLGFDYIPEKDRYLSIRTLAYFWVGANAYILYLSIGALTLAGGLSLVEAIAAIVIGNALWIVIAYASIGGTRSGLPTMTLSRASMGIKGNLLHAGFGWIVGVGFEIANTLLGVFGLLALFDLFGWNSGAVGKVIATVVIVATSGYIAVVGHHLTMWIQKIFAIALTAVLVALFAFTVGKVHWSTPHALHLSGPANLGLFLAAVAVVAAGPLSYYWNCADYPRYLPTGTPSRKIVLSCFAGAGGISLFICLLGAMIASAVNLSDPVGGVRPLVPKWLFFLYVLCAIGGVISNNITAYYSSGLNVQAAGIRLKRYQATGIDAVISAALVLYVLFVQNFTTALNDFLVLILVWLVPFGAVWTVDGLIRKWRYDPVQIHDTSESGMYYGHRGVRVAGLVAFLAGAAVSLLTINTPVYTGYISSHLLHHGDLSWIAPLIVSATVYWLLARKTVRGEAARSDTTIEPSIHG